MTIPGNLISTILTANPSKVINEIVTVTPTVMAVGSPATISITGGVPNTSFLITASGSNTSFPKLYASNYGGYTPFLNTYGAWTSPDAVGWNYPVETITVMYSTTIEKTQNYTLRVSADNEILLYIDDVLSGTNSNWGVHNDYTVAISAGVHIIRCVASNAGGPASFAAALYDPANVMVWNTRPDSTGIASGILDATGNYTNTSVYVTNLEQPSESSRTYDYTVTFSGTGHIRPLSFTATRLDPYWSGTSLLLSADGVNDKNNNVFVDSSASNLTVTRYGNTTQGSVNPFMSSTVVYNAALHGGSMYFDGVGDYLTMPNTAATQFGSGDFTVEYWFKTSLTPNTTYWNSLVSVWTGGVQAGPQDAWYTGIRADTGKFTFLLGDGAGTRGTVDGPTGLNDDKWHHVAAVRTGTSMKLFIDGALQGTTIFNGSIPNATVPLGICASYAGNGSAPGATSAATIANVRIVKGTAVYTANFTPPTAPVTAIAGTTVLLNGTNAGIYDSAARIDVETVGGAKLSTTVKKYGSASMAFDGVGDYLKLSNAGILSGIGSTPFTIEAWVYFTSIPSQSTIYGDYQNSTTGIILGEFRNKIAVWYTGDAVDQTSTTTLTANTWYHVAISGSAGNMKLFVNGIAEGGTYTGSILPGSGNASIGSFLVGDTSYSHMPGYIDDFRITKGTARYTANFTPPTALLS